MEKELDLSMNMEEIISSYEKVESEHNNIEEKIESFNDGDKRTLILILTPAALLLLCWLSSILGYNLGYDKDMVNKFITLGSITCLGLMGLSAIILSVYQYMIDKHKNVLSFKSKIKNFIFKNKITLLKKRSVLDENFFFLSKPEIQENIRELFEATQPPLFSLEQEKHALACANFNRYMKNKDYLNAASVLTSYFKDKEVILEDKLNRYL